jgi:hypothetical protein
MIEETPEERLMLGKWLVRGIGTAIIIVAMAAVAQELEKPPAERRWNGKIGIIPYDFRMPTMDRFREAFWNENSERIFTRTMWGVGWSINLYAILEKMRLVGDLYLTEEDFLMPTESLRRILEKRPAIKEGMIG